MIPLEEIKDFHKTRVAEEEIGTSLLIAATKIQGQGGGAQVPQDLNQGEGAQVPQDLNQGEVDGKNDHMVLI